MLNSSDYAKNYASTIGKSLKEIISSQKTIKARWKDRVPVTASPDDKHSGYASVFVRDTSPTKIVMFVVAKCVPHQVTTHLHHLLTFSLKDMNAGFSKKRGDLKFRISKNKEAVYYHPNANCVAQKHGEGNATNITVPDHIRPHSPTFAPIPPGSHLWSHVYSLREFLQNVVLSKYSLL